MIRTLIVDDEPPARQRLRSLLRDEPDVTVVGECGTVNQAAKALSKGVDLVFLDIQMPGRDGFSLLDEVDRRAGEEPAVVFVTAHAEHAVRAFGVRAVDYLLKPFPKERLAESLERVRAMHVEREPAAARRLDRLPVDVGGRIRLLDPAEIDYLRAEGNYVRVHAGTSSYLVRDTLTGLAARLGDERFLRIHRSLVVRLDRVHEVEVLDHGEMALRLSCGSTLVSGRAFRERLRNALGL